MEKVEEDQGEVQGVDVEEGAEEDDKVGGGRG